VLLSKDIQALDYFPASIRAVPEHFMVDLLAPARAFLHAREAHSADTAEALKDGANLISRHLSGQEEQNASGKIKTNSPLERVDYSIPHHDQDRTNRDAKSIDPYVIEINLELDDKALVAAKESGKQQSTDQASERARDERVARKLLIPLG
jgi:hypothetical protein